MHLDDMDEGYDWDGIAAKLPQKGRSSNYITLSACSLSRRPRFGHPQRTRRGRVALGNQRGKDLQEDAWRLEIRGLRTWRSLHQSCTPPAVSTEGVAPLAEWDPSHISSEIFKNLTLGRGATMDPSNWLWGDIPSRKLESVR